MNAPLICFHTPPRVPIVIQPQHTRRGERERESASLLPSPVIDQEEEEMVRVATFFAMSFGAFLFWESMDKVHVWFALHHDEKMERLEREREIKRLREELLAEGKRV